jgi:hypothetical protein
VLPIINAVLRSCSLLSCRYQVRHLLQIVSCLKTWTSVAAKVSTTTSVWSLLSPSDIRSIMSFHFSIYRIQQCNLLHSLSRIVCKTLHDSSCRWVALSSNDLCPIRLMWAVVASQFEQSSSSASHFFEHRWVKLIDLTKHNFKRIMAPYVLLRPLLHAVHCPSTSSTFSYLTTAPRHGRIDSSSSSTQSKRKLARSFLEATISA